jgi:hypothetical protein
MGAAERSEPFVRWVALVLFQEIMAEAEPLWILLLTIHDPDIQAVLPAVGLVTGMAMDFRIDRNLGLRKVSAKKFMWADPFPTKILIC